MSTDLEKKIEKLSGKTALKLEKMIENKLLYVNKQISEIDDRYKGMYSHLVREFLVTLEKRVYQNSVAVISLQKIMIEMYAEQLGITYDEAKQKLEERFAEEADKVVEEDKKEQDAQEDVNE